MNTHNSSKKSNALEVVTSNASTMSSDQTVQQFGIVLGKPKVKKSLVFQRYSFMPSKMKPANSMKGTQSLKPAKIIND